MPFDAAFLANPDRVAAAVIARVVAPPPPVDLEQWAAANIVFGSDSPFPGPYNPERFPFFGEILDALGPDHPARTVVFKKSAQLGGTVLAQIFLGGCLDSDPGPFLYNHPTEPNAIRWSRTKWKPMVRGCQALKDILAAPASREGGNSLLYQERRDGRGFLQIGGANSEASLSMISAPRQVQDDLAKWELNAAGDPELQSDSRSKAYEGAKIFKCGTPLLKESCRVTRNFARSDQRHYHVPCPHCGHEHPLDFDNMRPYLDETHPEQAHFVCPDCGGIIEQRHRAAMLAQGRWVAHRPGAPVVGFFLWSAYSPLESWQRIAEAYFAAKGDPPAEQVFTNDTLGQAYEGAGESPPWQAIQDRATANPRPRGVVPSRGLLLVLAMDCQDDRVECHLKAFGAELYRATVDYLVVEGHIGEPETWDQLDQLLARSWPDEHGRPCTIQKAGIDAGAWTTEVYDWARRHPQSKVIMTRGVPQDTAPVLARVSKERNRLGKIIKYAKRFFNVGQSGIKLGLYKNLTKTDPLERGYCDYPAGLDDEFYQQLTIEKRSPVKRRDGNTQYLWVKPSGARNEALDTEVIAEAVATSLGWRTRTPEAWAKLEAEREALPKGQLDLEDLMHAPPRPAEAASSVPAARATPKPAAPAKSAASLAARLPH